MEFATAMRVSRILKWLLGAAGILVLAGVAWAIYDYDRIDRCLDHGGSWHYDREYCDFEVSYEGPRP